jgi:circadian clock protein KaiC
MQQPQAQAIPVAPQPQYQPAQQQASPLPASPPPQASQTAEDLRMEEERRRIEEERERLRIERERLERERQDVEKRKYQEMKINVQNASITPQNISSSHSKKPTPAVKQEASSSSSSDNEKDSLLTQNLESKLDLLEQKLKNMDYSDQEGGGGFKFKNEVIPEEVEFVSEPVGDRAQTGINGLDPVIQGGLRRLSTTLVAGGPGSGKTIFGMQFLINGAEKYNEPGVFITFEQQKEDLYDLFSNFGWDLKALEKEKKLAILHFTPEQVAKMMKGGGGSLRDSIDSVHASRVVIDSLSDLMMLYKSETAKREACIDIFDMFRKLKCTTVAISEQEVNPLKHISSVLEYQVDGVILLYNERIGDIRQRAIEIFKMRGTKHAGRIFPIRITDSGVIILSDHAIGSK